jgi:hypothetical protein
MASMLPWASDGLRRTRSALPFPDGYRTVQPVMDKQPAVAEPAPLGSERDILLGWLAFHRDALARNCAGLAAERLVEPAAPPSDLSLLGLVRHLTEMEHWYLEGTLSGRRLQPLYCPDDDPDGDIVGIDASMVEPSLQRWREQISAVDSLLSDARLDDRTASGGHTVRWCLLKVLQEYARHNGHADILRERIDGAVGE